MSEATALGGGADGGNQAAGGAGGANGSGGSGNGGSTGGSTGGNGSGGSGGAGSGTVSWRDALPADLKDNAILSKFTDVGNLAKSYIHAQQQIGKKGVIVPGEKATDEEWQGFFRGIGVPEADKYEVKVPDGQKVPDSTVSWFKEKALALGLLPKQANSLLQEYLSFEKNTLDEHMKGAQNEAKVQMDGLKKEWGDAYPKELASAKFAVKELGGDEFIKYLDQTGMGNDVHLIRIFAKAAKLMGEDKLREGGVNQDGVTAAELDAAIADLRGKGNENGLYDKNHPNHPAAMAKLESLYKQKTGGR